MWHGPNALQQETYLVLVDKASGFLWCELLTKTNTSAVTSVLLKIFQDFGYPATIRSDNGPQFRSEFKDFCLAHGITHETSSPHNPESNGLAEAAVKNAKLLMAKCDSQKSNFKEALLHWRNTPRRDGFSPAQLLFGRRQQTSLPTLPIHHQQIDIPNALKEKDVQHLMSQESRNQSGTPARQFLPGLRVVIRNDNTNKWTTPAVILSQQGNRPSYIVQTDEGKTFTRSHRLIREDHPHQLVSNQQSNNISTPDYDQLPNNEHVSCILASPNDQRWLRPSPGNIKNRTICPHVLGELSTN